MDAEPTYEQLAQEVAALRQENQHLKAHLAQHKDVVEYAEQHTLHRRLAENALDIVFRMRLRPEPRFEYVSPAATHVVGYTPEDHYADPGLGFKLVHPDDREKLAEMAQGTAALKQPVVMRWLHRDGRVIWVEQHNVPIFDADGNLIAIEGISRDITARKQVEEQLRESEQRYRTLIRNLPVVLFITDQQGFITLSEGKGLQSLSLQPGELVGVNIFAGFPELSNVVEALRRTLAGETTLATDTFQERRLETYLSPLYDQSGTQSGAIGLSLDVTERQETEEAYRALVDNSLQGMVITQDGRIVFANQMMSEMNGYSIADMLAMDMATILALVYPPDLEIVKYYMHHRLAGTPVATRYEYRIIRKDGAVRWLEANGARISYRGRTALLGTYIDITERKQAEMALVAGRANMEAMVIRRTRELRRERDHNRAILESLGDAVQVINTNGFIQYMNPAAATLAGLSLEAIKQSEHIWWVWAESWHNPELAHILETVRSGRTWRGELLDKRPDGSTYDTAMTIAPLLEPDSADHLVGYVVVQRDITALKVAERLKDQFVSNVSHELRTPMSLITLLSGSLDMLYERMDDSKRRSVIRDLRDHSRVLSDLIEDVLEISRIDSGRIAAEQQPFNLVTVLHKEVEHLRPLADKKRQLLTTEPGPAHVGIRGNEHQLRQVVRNLLNNAIKYTPENGSITCACQIIAPDQAPDMSPAEQVPCLLPGLHKLPPGSGAWAVLRVVDTGVGIAPEDMPHVFERFYRAEAQGDIPGTGLGLSIAWELIHRHGGYLAADSQPGAGSCFACYIPTETEEKP